MMYEPVSSIMTTDLITVKPTDKLLKVQAILSGHRIHHVPVVDEGGQLVGLLTTYDLFKMCEAREQYAHIEIKDVMTRRLATLEPTAKIGTAAEIFLENLFHALPIIENGVLVGLITSFDVLKYCFTKEYPKHQWIKQGNRQMAVS